MMIWQSIIVSPQSSLKRAIEVMNYTGLQTVLVCNDQNQLIGILSDGDLRKRVILKHDFNVTIAKIMNKSPFVVSPSTPMTTVMNAFKNHAYRVIPVVDENLVLVNCHLIDFLLGKSLNPAPMLIMAGGLGTRMGNLTKNCPKPMLQVKEKPILENIIKRAIQQGFDEFYISVNYLKDVIIDYFGDGSAIGAKINYIEETKPLGTAGSIQKMPTNTGTCVVINGDVDSDIDFQLIQQHHISNNAYLTMAVVQHTIQNPYGVIFSRGVDIIKIEEKPSWETHISAGIYVIDMDCKSLIGANERIDMPQLFTRAAASKKRCIIYQLNGKWADIGTPESLQAADRG